MTFLNLPNHPIKAVSRYFPELRRSSDFALDLFSLRPSSCLSPPSDTRSTPAAFDHLRPSTTTSLLVLNSLNSRHVHSTSANGRSARRPAITRAFRRQFPSTRKNPAADSRLLAGQKTDLARASPTPISQRVPTARRHSADARSYPPRRAPATPNPSFPDTQRTEVSGQNRHLDPRFVVSSESNRDA